MLDCIEVSDYGLVVLYTEDHKPNSPAVLSRPSPDQEPATRISLLPDQTDHRTLPLSGDKNRDIQASELATQTSTAYPNISGCGRKPGLCRTPVPRRRDTHDAALLSPSLLSLVQQRDPSL